MQVAGPSKTLLSINQCSDKSERRLEKTSPWERSDAVPRCYSQATKLISSSKDRACMPQTLFEWSPAQFSPVRNDLVQIHERPPNNEQDVASINLHEMYLKV